MSEAISNPIYDQALLLAKEAQRTDPSITDFYWFPAENEVRLIEVAKNMPPSLDTVVQPFYFPPAPSHNMPAPSGVALILSGEDLKLQPPIGWGDWSSATKLNVDFHK